MCEGIVVRARGLSCGEILSGRGWRTVENKAGDTLVSGGSSVEDEEKEIVGRGTVGRRIVGGRVGCQVAGCPCVEFFSCKWTMSSTGKWMEDRRLEWDGWRTISKSQDLLVCG